MSTHRKSWCLTVNGEITGIHTNVILAMRTQSNSICMEYSPSVHETCNSADMVTGSPILMLIYMLLMCFVTCQVDHPVLLTKLGIHQQSAVKGTTVSLLDANSQVCVACVFVFKYIMLTLALTTKTSISINTLYIRIKFSVDGTHHQFFTLDKYECL